MLAASSATAVLRSLNRQAVGTSALQRGHDLAVLLDAYQSTIRRISKNVCEIDVPQTYLESAWLGDWEAAYDIALQQAATYLDVVVRRRNPAWAAVTGYYAAFFAARTLLYGVGIGQRSLPRIGIMRGGLYELTRRPGSSVGFSTLRCEKQSGGGSHKNAWAEVNNLLDTLLLTGGLDLKSVNVLASMKNLIDRPQGLSAFRNKVNYSLEIAGNPVSLWATETTRILDSDALESVIGTGAPSRDEHRIELLLLAMLSWTRTLYADYLDRASRPDQRRKRARDSAIASEDPATAAVLQRWL